MDSHCLRALALMLLVSWFCHSLRAAEPDEATTCTTVRVVRGRVLRPDGSPPTSGTLVLLIGEGRMNRLGDSEARANPLFQFRTDAAGRFSARFYVSTYTGSFTRPPKDWPRNGLYQFIVQPAEGFAGALSEEFYVLQKNEPAQHATDFKLVGDQPVNVTLPLKKGTVVEGFVLDHAGKPVPQMQVSLWTVVKMSSHTSAEGGVFGQKMQVRPDGGYRFENVYPGRLELDLDHLGRGKDYKQFVWLRTRTGGEPWEDNRIDHFTPAAGKPLRVDMEIAPPRTFAVTGRVLDPAGEPIPGAEIAVAQSDHKSPETWGDYHDFVEGKTDAQGYYRILTNTPWYRFIRAKKEGYEERLYLSMNEEAWANETNMQRVKLAPGNYDFTLPPQKKN